MVKDSFFREKNKDKQRESDGKSEKSKKTTERCCKADGVKR